MLYVHSDKKIIKMILWYLIKKAVMFIFSVNPSNLKKFDKCESC